ncbi:hypothetical protein PAXRUDRAFT_167326 [Paxillus rubicundulus Ve08.2h10]|uniref:Uncharacterized protein n=1 Tax=Paxillus rubicundulus Ve08.2h10 TaxID=930991 RepID=A0A0D0CPQ2_9AGAM|nr:hypothetical protein PAXRUDRAFT_167326 [Paxillus rubicundulus Ve08.2h10]
MKRPPSPQLPSQSGHDHNRQQTFRPSRSPDDILPICAVCLGCQPHPVIECRAAHTWDSCFDTFSERIRKALWTKYGKQLCSKWQRDDGCVESTHNVRHLCSGCGAATHGAHRCPCAQKAPSANSV